ncbi:Sigma1B-adaptin [Asimina triloba]
MATLSFKKTPNPSLPFLKFHNARLQFICKFSIPLLSEQKRKRRQLGIGISCGLIEPDGGKLVELVVREAERDEKRREALSIPRIKLSMIDVQWVHVLSEGWASPLHGFMREAEFLQTLHFNSLRLADGSVVNMSVPIVLAIDDAQKQRIGESRKVALIDADDNPIAVLSE